MKVFINNQKAGVKAVAEYSIDTRETVVLKGSVISENISDAPTFKSKKSIKKAREGVVGNVLRENISFKSPSTAGNFVTGRSTDGLHSWKDSKGRTIKEIMEQAYY